MPAQSPRPYDPVEEAAAAMGVANLRPRYFVSGSPDATIGLNARYAQAVQQASDLGYDLARRPLQLEQERIQTSTMGMQEELLGVKTDRVRNALANRSRIESVLAGIDPTAPDYRSKRKELAALGADEILGAELGQLDQEAQPYEKVRGELIQRDEEEKQLGPKRQLVLTELQDLDPKDPEFRKKTFGVLAKYPEVLRDPILYRAVEDISRTGYEFEANRKMRERELMQLDPDTRRLYDEQIKAGADPDNALFGAQRARQIRLLKREALKYGLDAKQLADAKDDPDVLADMIAMKQGEMSAQRQALTFNKARLTELRAKMSEVENRMRLDNPDTADRDKALEDYKTLNRQLMDLSLGGPDEDNPENW